MHCVIFYVKC